MSDPQTNPDALKPFLGKIAEGATLSREEAAEVFNIMMSGIATPTQIGAILMGLRQRGETVDEIAGAAQTMRSKAVAITAPANAIDTCGTGGDASGTYNISTAAALVVAGAGLPVAKHGNKAMSSKSGSADVLAALGVNLDASPTQMEAALAHAGVCFMFAPKHHGAMRFVGPSRVEMGMRTIFNLLGPLSNPAGAKRQVIGVFSKAWIEPMARVLGELGSEHVWVVHGEDGLDELTTTGASHVAELKDGKVTSFTITPEDAGLPVADPAALKGGDAATNAAAITDLLEGSASAYRDITILNAAAALLVGGMADSLKAGAELAAESIDSGKAKAALTGLVAATHD